MVRLRGEILQGSVPRVIVADPDVRSAVVEEVAAVARYQVVHARTLQAALQSMREPAAALVAMRDPGAGQDGLDLLKEATRRVPAVLRVLVVAEVDADVEEAIRSAIVGWLIERPWKGGEITRAIDFGTDFACHTRVAKDLACSLRPMSQ